MKRASLTVPVMHSHSTLVRMIMMQQLLVMVHTEMILGCSLLFVYVDYQVEYSNCTDGQLRLTGGDTEMDGRVEICYGNVWFGVCSDNYNSYNKPSTICAALGYSSQGTYSNVHVHV